MDSPAFSLFGAEAVVKGCSNCHFLRPNASRIGRLCHSSLTTSRLVFSESHYDIFNKKEAGVGTVIHEIPLASILALEAGSQEADPHIELDVRDPRNKIETFLLFFRDDGWLLGAPGRLGERDQWIAAIRSEREKLGIPRPASKPRPVLQSASREVKDVGRILAGKFELLRQIGSGGMGLVFKGKDHSLDRPVAVKKMRPDVRLYGRAKSLFIKEAKLSASLHHPFIADIYAILEEDDEIYLVFEFVDGCTIQQVIDEKGFLTPNRVKHSLKYICEALAYAHASKVVHRDLKPSNIMLTRQGYAKVMDFGIAFQIKDTASRMSTTKSGEDAAGTLPYMAPEQELGTADVRSDIFALGATVYEMLSGELPFIGPNFYLQKEKMAFRPIAELAPNAPPELAQAVTRALSFDPKDRFQTVGEFAKAIGVG